MTPPDGAAAGRVDAPAPAGAEDLAGLVGSRICHDLISPLGAIGNGLELMMMTGGQPGAEMTLLADSVAAATARIRFLRVAFGAGEALAPMPPRDVVSILSEVTRGGRLRIAWDVTEPRPRGEVRAVFLALQCLEAAMPQGGTITVTRDEDGTWRVLGQAARLRPDPAAWSLLGSGGLPLAAAQVQFALLPRALAQVGRQLEVQSTEGALQLSF